MRIPKITSEELACFSNKKVIIYSKTRESNQLSKIYNYLNIPVLGLCNEDITEATSAMMYGLCQYTINEVIEMSLIQEDSIIIQYSSDVASDEKQMKKYFKNSLVSFSAISSHKLLNNYLPIIMYLELQNMTMENIKKRYYQKVGRAYAATRIAKLMNNQLSNPIIICNPPKTADISLNETFNYINQQEPSAMQRLLSKLHKNFSKKYINYDNIFHTPTAFHKDLIGDKQVKIITAVREPISQHLSHMFQGIDLPVDEYEVWIMSKLLLEGTDKESALEIIKDLFIDNGHDVQILFEDYISHYMGNVPNEDYEISYHLQFIQSIIEKFNEHIVDLYAYPFDKDKGYTIIKKDNIEIFVYQLEKLDTILPIFSQWIGVPVKKLIRGNVGADKWLGQLYKQAQKEICFSKEYFESCLNGKYIEHFYSDSDIEKFKNKWKKNISKPM